MLKGIVQVISRYVSHWGDFDVLVFTLFSDGPHKAELVGNI